MVIEKLKSYLHEPLVHFILIGTIIYALYYAVGYEEVDDERIITITAEEIIVLADQFAQRWNRPPMVVELENLIRNHSRVQVLYREAIAMGLDEGDYVIERRLASKLELLAKGLITPKAPTDEELKVYLQTNISDYQQPDRYTLTQVYFNQEKRKDNTKEAAQNTLADLRLSTAIPEDLQSYGDVSLLPSQIRRRTKAEISREFGQSFGDAISDLQVGAWHGPLVSGYGMHLVFIHDIVRAKAPEFEKIKPRIREDWTARQINEFSEQFIDELISRYVIVVEEADVEALPSTGSAEG
jgi:hypothetical protein